MRQHESKKGEGLRSFPDCFVEEGSCAFEEGEGFLQGVLRMKSLGGNCFESKLCNVFQDLKAKWLGACWHLSTVHKM